MGFTSLTDQSKRKTSTNKAEYEVISSQRMPEKTKKLTAEDSHQSSAINMPLEKIQDWDRTSVSSGLLIVLKSVELFQQSYLVKN